MLEVKLRVNINTTVTARTATDRQKARRQLTVDSQYVDLAAAVPRYPILYKQQTHHVLYTEQPQGGNVGRKVGYIAEQTAPS